MADLEAKVRSLECWARRDITVKPLSEAGIEGLGEGRTNHNFIVTVTHQSEEIFIRDTLRKCGLGRGDTLRKTLNAHPKRVAVSSGARLERGGATP